MSDQEVILQNITLTAYNHMIFRCMIEEVILTEYTIHKKNVTVCEMVHLH